MIKELTNKVHKLIKPKCEDCGGEGSIGHQTHPAPYEEVNCSTCQGKGYVIPLEEGCEVIDKDGFIWKYISRHLAEETFFVTESGYVTAYLSEDDFTNLGKPITLQDILLALSKKGYKAETNLDGYITLGKYRGKGCVEAVLGFKLPIKQPHEYTEETIKRLNEILS